MVRIWSKNVQKLLQEGLDQSRGRMPTVALELLVFLFQQLRKIQTELHSQGRKRFSELYFDEKESEPNAQYSLETESKRLQEEYQVGRTHDYDCQDRSYGSSKLTRSSWIGWGITYRSVWSPNATFG